MGRFRDLKRQARQRLHEAMSDTVWYLASEGATPLKVTVRLHVRFDALGELLRGGFAERQEITPRIVFWAAEVDPQRGAFVITQDMGVYRVDNEMPPDDQTITTEVIRMSDSQVTGLGWDPNADWVGFADPTAS